MKEVDILVSNHTDCIKYGDAKIKRTSHDEPHKLWINFNILRVPVKFYILGQLYIKQGGEYRITPYKIKGDACELAKNDPSVYPKVREAGNFPPPDDCPWAVGNYYLHGYYPNLTHLPPVLSTGDYLIEMMFFERNDFKDVLGGTIQVHVHGINRMGGMMGLN